MITKNRIHEIKVDRRKPFTDDVYQHDQAFTAEEAQAIREVAGIFGINVLISLPDGAVLSEGRGKYLYQTLLQAIRTRFIFDEQFAQTSIKKIATLETELSMLRDEVDRLSQRVYFNERYIPAIAGYSTWAELNAHTIEQEDGLFKIGGKSEGNDTDRASQDTDSGEGVLNVN